MSAADEPFACYPHPDSHAAHFAEDEWFRLASAPVTYVYNCYVNILRGVDCTVHVNQGETVEFPCITQGQPEGANRR